MATFCKSIPQGGACAKASVNVVKCRAICYDITRKSLKRGGAAVSEEHGDIRITDGVIAVCAAKAALDTKGVYSLVSGITDTIQQNILGKSPESKGVKINQNDGEIVIDLYINVEYGVRIPSVAWKIQENVKREVEEMTGMHVTFVNIHVQGIHFEEGKES